MHLTNHWVNNDYVFFFLEVRAYVHLYKNKKKKNFWQDFATEQDGVGSRDGANNGRSSKDKMVSSTVHLL